jgi:alkanesulfonate monooxygenase SsuD/methylene tetrahydromethanopterin reductase-like flavin-dependent oxidoreductase (luciferase family)
MAQTAEVMGFDSFWLSDHLLFRAVDEEPQGQWDCWSLLAAIGARTQHIEFGPLVSCTSFRNPALLAKMAATVDEISGGRLTLGLGAGWNEPEYVSFGYPFDHRVSRFAEALRIIHGLLREGFVDFDGQFYSARDCELRPRGPRPSGPPIMIGTAGARMLRLTAQYADGWNAFFWSTENRPDGVPPLRAVVDAACVKVGRDPATLARTVCVLVELPGATGTPFPQPPLRGPAEEIARELQAYARQGIGHVQLRLDPNTVAGLEQLAPVLDILDGAGQAAALQPASEANP